MFDNLIASLKKYFALLAVRRLAHRGNMELFDVNQSWHSVKRVLICWPFQGLDLQLGGVILNHLENRFTEAVLTIVALPGVGASPMQTGMEILQLQPKDLNIWGLPNNRARDRLRSLQADVAVDLSSKFDPRLAFLCLISGAPIKVGFALPRSDLAFNYQVRPKRESSEIDRYRALARYLG
ncbi:MAG: hypothetical protein V2A61_05920 [Calditrichota bacterium]